MQAFKIEHFQKDKPGHLFPRYESLPAAETWTIRAQLATQAGLEPGVDPLVLTQRLASQAVPLDGADAESEAFDLAALLQEQGIRPRPEVYVNWYRYDEIDRIRFSDLAAGFSDVWYPSSDDIDVLDSTFSWILSVDHEGAVKLLRFEQR